MSAIVATTPLSIAFSVACEFINTHWDLGVNPRYDPETGADLQRVTKAIPYKNLPKEIVNNLSSDIIAKRERYPYCRTEFHIWSETRPKPYELVDINVAYNKKTNKLDVRLNVLYDGPTEPVNIKEIIYSEFMAAYNRRIVIDGLYGTPIPVRCSSECWSITQRMITLRDIYYPKNPNVEDNYGLEITSDPENIIHWIVRETDNRKKED